MSKKLPEQRTIIIITGGPGTGKSGIARRLLDYIDDPEIVQISYDSIKEKEWDAFGFDNAEQKDRLNWWCLEEFYLTIQKRMWENKTILIEYPFYQRHKPKLQELIEASGYSAVTVYLYTDMKTVYERGTNRDNAGGRHPGHLLNCYHKETYRPEMLDSVERIAPSYEEFVSSIAHKDYDINLGLRVPIDVTTFKCSIYREIYQAICEYQKK
ncbi:MAG: zeta toxin family protein [Dorea sp.]|nr:zeta toxin family protein [Dorea sp.]